MAIAEDGEVLLRGPHVFAGYHDDPDAAVNERSRIEQIKDFVVLARDLTQAQGELTPTLKVRRDVVHALYARHDREAVFAGFDRADCGLLRMSGAHALTIIAP